MIKAGAHITNLDNSRTRVFIALRLVVPEKVHSELRTRKIARVSPRVHDPSSATSPSLCSLAFPSRHHQPATQRHVFPKTSDRTTAVTVSRLQHTDGIQCRIFLTSSHDAEV